MYKEPYKEKYDYPLLQGTPETAYCRTQLFLSLIEDLGNPSLKNTDRVKGILAMGKPMEIAEELQSLITLLEQDTENIDYNNIKQTALALKETFEREAGNDLSTVEILSGMRGETQNHVEIISEDMRQYLWIYDLTKKKKKLNAENLRSFYNNLLMYHPNTITMVNNDAPYKKYRKMWMSMAKKILNYTSHGLSSEEVTVLKEAIAQPVDTHHEETLMVLQYFGKHNIDYTINRHPDGIMKGFLANIRHDWARKICNYLYEKAKPDDYRVWYNQLVDIMNHKDGLKYIPHGQQESYKMQLKAKIIERTKNSVKLLAELHIIKLTLGTSKLIPLRLRFFKGIVKTLFDVDVASFLELSYDTLYSENQEKVEGTSHYHLNYVVGNAMIPEMFLLEIIGKKLQLDIKKDSALGKEILFLDQYGRGEIGLDGIHEASVGNYTPEQITYMASRLMEHGLHKHEAFDLIDRGYIGRVDVDFIKSIPQKNLSQQ